MVVLVWYWTMRGTNCVVLVLIVLFASGLVFSIVLVLMDSVVGTLAVGVLDV